MLDNDLSLRTIAAHGPIDIDTSQSCIQTAHQYISSFFILILRLVEVCPRIKARIPIMVLPQSKIISSASCLQQHKEYRY